MSKIEWIEKLIADKRVKYYEYKYFKNIEEIGKGAFSNVYCANYKNSPKNFVLKSLISLDDIATKEIIREVITKYNISCSI